jgi:hypothetical protein
MKTLVFMCCFIMAAAFVKAQEHDTIYVPGPDSLTIQEGIDSAQSGDIIIVSEGTYYEQINFLGKKPLMVASEFFLDGDTSHITKTIIDGSQIPPDEDTASVVLFISGEDTTSILCGFTITRGRGTLDWFPGIVGGGIYARNSGLTLSHNIITANSLDDSIPGGTQGVNGGGIMIDNSNNSWSIIENNEISFNSITSTDYNCGGGGIAVLGNTRIINNAIKSNSCIQNSANIAFYNIGGGLFYQAYGNQVLVLQNNIIENNMLTGINGNGAGAQLYESRISCTGNEFKGNKINGPMPQSFGGGGLALTLLKNGSRISGNTFINNESVGNGGGLYDWGTSNWYIIENNYFFNNSASSGGGLASSHSRLILQNNVFFKNEASLSGGALYLDGNDPADQHSACIINSSFSENSASTGGAITANWVNPIILNSIFWQDSADLGPEIRGGTYFVELAYSNIDTSLIFHPLWEVILGEGMINQDPVFADTLLNLTMLSPGIDMGIDEVSCHNQTWTAPLYDIDYLIRPWNGGVDMGAHEYGSIPVGVLNPPVTTRQLSAVRSYPNPLSDYTTFEYELFEPGIVTLTILNQLGQEVEILVNELQDKGEHQFTWNAGELPSGIYFYRLTAGSRSSTGKMVLVK